MRWDFQLLRRRELSVTSRIVTITCTASAKCRRGYARLKPENLAELAEEEIDAALLASLTSQISKAADNLWPAGEKSNAAQSRAFGLSPTKALK